MNKTKKIVIGTALAVAVIAAGGLAVAKKGDRSVSVRTEKVGHQDLVSVVTASGIIQPKRKADISADVSGRVVEVAVEEGDVVQKGDLLLRIDPNTYQALVRRAEAAVAQARAQEAQARANVLQAESAAKRAEQLAAGDRLISAQDLEQARTQLKVTQAQEQAARYGVSQAEASLVEANESLRKTTILAPMAGRVTRLNIREGETAVVGTMNNPGSLLLTVADLKVMEASVKVDETDVPDIVVGDSAAIHIDAFPDKTFSGRVTRIGNSAITGQGTAAGNNSTQEQAVDFEVVITLDQPPAELRPDLSATADIVTATRKQAIAVPIIAVTVRDPDGKKFKADDADRNPNVPASQAAKTAKQTELEGVFVVKDGKAAFVPVKIGISGERYFEVQSGLKGGETVIAGPYAAIRDLEADTPVQVEQAPVASGTAAKEAS
jgi:HlyD family secretion protein